MSTLSRSGTASIAAEPVSPDVAPTIVTRSPRAAEHVVEQPADELQGDVLERQRRPVEQLEQPVVGADLHQRAHRRDGRRWRRRRSHMRREVRRVDLAVDERRT